MRWSYELDTNQMSANTFSDAQPTTDDKIRTDKKIFFLI